MNHQLNYKPSSFIDIDYLNEPAFSFEDFKDIFKRKDRPASTAEDTDNRTGAGKDIFAGLLGIVGALAPILPALGVGSKYRIAEANANAEIYKLQNEAQEADSKQMKQLLIIGGVVLFVIVIITLTLRK